MPRRPRPQVAGGLYHVTTKSNFARLAFRDEKERKLFLDLLEQTVKRRRWSCRSYCLLSTHYHLLIETPEPDIAAGMQYINGCFAQWTNWHREERSHVFGGRYKSPLVRDDGHAMEVHRYIALNPVRAGLVRDPERWRWSSLAATLGRTPAPRFLDVEAALAPFGDDTAVARRRLKAFIRDGLEADAP